MESLIAPEGADSKDLIMSESEPNKIRVVYIPIEGNTEIKLVEKTNEACRNLVGGALEVIDLQDKSFLIVNEEAEAMGLKHNMRASILARKPISGNAYLVHLDDFQPGEINEEAKRTWENRMQGLQKGYQNL